MKKIFIAVAMLALLCSCNAVNEVKATMKVMPTAKSAASAVQMSAPEVVVTAEPSAAMEKIYDNVDVMGLNDATQEELEETFLISPEDVSEYYIRYSDGNFGVADVAIIKPMEEKKETVFSALHEFKAARTKEFEKYNILNAHEISKSAEIFEQGEYVIMVMTNDNTEARKIIDQHIPKVKAEVAARAVMAKASKEAK